MVLVLDGKTDLNQISLTGVRAITLIGLLAIAPRSMEEIRNAFINARIIEESQSDDILRIDLNTVKAFGCEISRSDAKTDFKYVMHRHPFTIPINQEDIKILKKLFDKMKYSMDINKLIECDKFLNKLSKYIYDTDIKEEFMGISPLKYYNQSMIMELYLSCINNYTVTLEYRKEYAQDIQQKELIAQKLIFKNDKLYLYGYDFKKQDSVTLLFKRIRSVISKRITEKDFEPKVIKIIFTLKNFDKNMLTENEKIIDFSKNIYTIEGSYFNEFLAIQRILSFGPKCTVITPIEFRNKIIAKLKEMKKLYET